ncbi:MAG: ATP-binding cassette domain-containing protein [Firmicutes bacterium]|nr:ATP-binding cassette domain-containing protein [Bacillota bacterium]
MAATDTLLEVRGLKKYFPLTTGGLGFHRGLLKAVDDVSFTIQAGETVGLVGESGCGKTTVGLTILRLYEPTAGQIVFEGTEITGLRPEELLPFRRKMQMIFQDPFASLNPRMTVGDIIGEPLDIHGLARGKERTERIYELLRQVGLSPDHANRYPHEFSGGQRQRIGVARALAAQPRFIICDEPISALDVSIQAQIVNMLQELQVSLGLTYLFIAHDLAMVKHISNRVLVMYLGKIVEEAPSAELYENPLHPYTQALLSAIPIPDPGVERTRQRISLAGDVPSPVDPPAGCRFVTRCPRRLSVCAGENPKMKTVAPGHTVACHLY